MITFDTVNSLVRYEPETGHFFWKVSRHNGIYAGDRAGSVFVNRHNGKSYVKLHLARHHLVAHRVAVLLMTGSFPEHEVDHIDGNGTNNVYTNLRTATRQINAQNYRKRKDCKTRQTGVKPSVTAGKWVAKINVNGSRMHLGTFLSEDEAIAARKQAEVEYGFHPNHGQERPL